jgi:hypothetical protein
MTAYAAGVTTLNGARPHTLGAHFKLPPDIAVEPSLLDVDKT